MLFLTVLSVNTAYAQTKVYASIQSVSAESHIENKANAADSDLTTRARIKAYSGIVVVGGAYEGYMELQFPTTLAANTTSYVKIGADDNILAPLVGGTLGGLLNTVVGVVLTGSQQFTVQAKDGTNVVLEGRSEVANAFAGDKLRIAQNDLGEYFVVITPDVQYNRIRLTNRLGALIALGVTKRLDVYEAFYVSNTAACGLGALTSYSGDGISLSLLQLGTAGVFNAKNAIDANLTNSSQLGLGLLGVAASVQQTVYFEGPASASDMYYIKMSVNPDLIALGLLSNITVVAHNGSTQVGQPVSINSLLNLDLLGLFNQGQVVSIPFTPSGAADRITLKLTGLASVEINQTIDLYGIVKSNLGVSITGGGSYMVNDSVTLVSNVTGCSSPYTYLWSQSSTTANITAPTGTPGTFTYTLTVTDKYGISAIAHADVVVEEPPVGGTITGSQALCPGNVPTGLSLSGYTGNIIRWESAADMTFTIPVTISNTTASLSGAAIGAVNETTYFRAVVGNAMYQPVYSDVASVTAKKTTWNGTSWNNGVPDIDTGIYMTGNYSEMQDVNGCYCQVSNNAVVAIPSGKTITLHGALDVTSGSFTLHNNANLLQLTNAVNTGNISVKRQTTPLYLLDYTMWSSPVTGTQTLKSFSPQTVNNRFYVYDTQQDSYLGSSTGTVNPLTDVFALAKGYLIRIGANHPAYVNSTIPGTIWEGVFTGVPNNGDISYTLSAASSGYNLIGNPYPSPIDAVQFLNQNLGTLEGTLYIWRKKNDTTTPQHYIAINSFGVYVSNGEPGTEVDPNGVIRQGQGFLVKVNSNPTGTTANFNNGMRLNDTSNIFFRNGQNANTAPERHGMWINLLQNNKFVSQLYAGYVEGATDGEDNADAQYITPRATALSSYMNNKEFIIQGKALPFRQDDVIPLSFKSADTGTFKIEIDHTEGVLLQNTVYLKDSYTNIVHNLTEGAYTFDTAAGTFNNRFEIIYNNVALGNKDFADDNSVIAWAGNGKVNLKSGFEAMKKVEAFDVSGRQLYAAEVGTTETSFNLLPVKGEVIIIRIVTENGTYNRKIIMQ